MTSRLAIAILVVSLTGCARSAATSSSSDESQQGGIASQCEFTHREAIDPIRFANGDTMSHLHDFFGATGVRQEISAKYLLAQEKTCDAAGDHSLYWVPTMFDGEAEVRPESMAVYVMTPVGVDPNDVQLPPNGLQMITYTSSWKCSRQGPATPSLQQCPKNAATRLQLEFPHCWDGEGTAFGTVGAHVVVSDDACPDSHPYVLPRIVMEIRYKIDTVDEISFSSGDVTSVHGDIFFAWNQESLERDFDACLRRNIMCGVTWSTGLGV